VELTALIMLAANQHGYMINVTDCMYNKPPPEDEQLIYLKHVEDIYRNKFKKGISLILIQQSVMMHGPYDVHKDLLSYEWFIYE
jgi:hypothetical protein